MTDDLIARLRANPTLRSTMFEAADALKAQARRIAELEEVHEANLKAIQINADVFADGMKKIMALCDAKDARIAELEAALNEVRIKTIEECAKAAEELTYLVDIKRWSEMTKKEHGEYACHQCAAEIRKLSARAAMGETE